MNIRHLAPEEWAAYRDLRLEALRSEPQAFCSSLAETNSRPESYWRERLEAAKKATDSWLLFACGDLGELLGMVGAVVEEPGTATVVSMYVTNKARGQGTGRALMNALLKELSQATAITRVSLQVNSIQKSAVKLYRDCGFSVAEMLEMRSGDGKEYDDFMMEKPVKSPSAFGTEKESKLLE